jgi:hypothetical protein
MVFGLTCTRPKGVAAPGNVLPNPEESPALIALVLAPIIGLTYWAGNLDWPKLLMARKQTIKREIILIFVAIFYIKLIINVIY